MDRASSRVRRHRRIRKRVIGYPARPRMSIYRSHKHLIVQLINDFENRTLLGCSTQAPELKEHVRSGGNVAAAEQLGRWVAAEAIKRGIRQVVFDRGGYHYHGRVKAVAEAARQGGLEF